MASKVGSVWYLAIRLTPKPGAGIAEAAVRGYVPNATGSIVYAGVVMTSRSDGEGGYKDLCESMGPSDAAAPLKLLPLLSPLDPETDRHAQGWRDRVRATHAARRGRHRRNRRDRPVYVLGVRPPLPRGGRPAVHRHRR